MARARVGAKSAPAAGEKAAAAAVVGKEEVWDIGRVKPDPKNPRRHPKGQVAQLRELFRAFGQVWPILVKPSGVIIAGHGRLEAAKLEGFKKVKVIVARNWTPAQIELFALADNKVPLNADWDKELLQEKLTGLRDLGVDLTLTAFSKSELGKLDVLLLDGAVDDDGDDADAGETWEIIISCKDEKEQRQLLTRLQKDGVSCRALVA